MSSVPAHPYAPSGESASDRRRVAVWRWVQRLLFATSFHNAYRWRRFLLGRFGATIDPTVRIRPSCRIDRPWNLSMARKSALGDGAVIYAAGPVRIGERSVISQYVVIAAASGPVRGEASADGVTIGDDAWIAAESYVPGGTVVPDGLVVGARSVLSGGLEPWTIASGDPAVSRRAREYAGRA